MPEVRSAVKRDAIVEAATAAFLANGFRDTSMDAVAAAAGVSKQTVYSHFEDKAGLFVAIVIGTVDAARHAEVDEVEIRDDVVGDLTALVRGHLAAALQPRVLALRRLVIAEADRFPELGRAFYDRGAGRATTTLRTLIDQLSARGVLDVDDPEVAARHLNWLVMSAPVNRAMLLGHEAVPGPAELDRIADQGVRAFLRAYGTQPPG